MTPQIDPFTMDIIQSSFRAISTEMFVAMKKTAMSPIIYEILDMGVALTDQEGNLLSSGAGIPVFVGMLEASVKTMSAKFQGQVKAGDIYVTNDPYNGGITHLNDVVFCKPIFYQNELVAWAANMAHWPDIGGMVPGGISTESYELYQEGLIIPGVKLFENDKILEPLMEILQANSRMPYNLDGDFWAGVAAVRIGEQRMLKLIDKYGLQTFLQSITELQNHGEQVSLASLKKLPKGQFTLDELMDDGRQMKVTVEVTETEFIVDLRDAPPQAQGPDNVSRDAVLVATQMIFKSITSPDTAANGGTYRPLKLLTQPGTLFHPNPPAACGMYYDTDIRICDLIWRAVFPMVKDQVTVGHFSSICGTFFGGMNPDTGKTFTIVEAQVGGWGAGVGMDGTSAMFSAFHGDTFNCPAEIAEARYGVSVERLSLNDEACGAGEFRGGKGVCVEYRTKEDNGWLTVGYSRSVVKPWGAEGGHEGSRNYIKILRLDGTIEEHFCKSGIPMNQGDVLQIRTANGAGYGNPKKRDPHKIQDDLKNEYITLEEAKTIYGYAA